MRRKRIWALLLSTLLLLGLLSGCGQGEDDGGAIITYLPSYHKLEAEISSIGTACSSADTMYFMAYIPGGKASYVDAFTGETYEYDTDQEALFRINLDGTGLTQMTGFSMTEIPEGREGGAYIENMLAGPDGALWLVETVNTYYYDLPENFDPMTDNQWQYYTEDQNRTLLRKLDENGAEVCSFDLCAVAAELDHAEERQNYYIYNVCMDQAGNLYFYYYGERGTLVVLDPQGEVLMTLENDDIGGSMVRLNDGRVAVLSYGEQMGLLPVELEQKDWGEALTTPSDFNSLFSGSGEFLYFYSTSSSVMGCREDGTIEKLLTWINCDLNQDELNGITVSSLDRVVAMRSDWSSEEPANELVVLERAEVLPENQRKTLRLAVMWLDYDLRSAVLDYNRSSTEYRIEVQDYSEYNTQDDYEAGITKLSTEIISGNVPDLFVADGLPLKQYAAKGLLEDLLPYIDADEELGGREAFVQPVLNAMLQDDSLYQLVSHFRINTAVTSARYVGEVSGWTLEEAQTAMANMPEDASLMYAYTTQNSLLRQLCRWNLSSYVNWETGECTFDTGEFEKLLEFSQLAPKKVSIDDDEWRDYEEATRIREGKQLMSVQTFYDWYDLLYQQSYWGEDMVFVGFPSDDRQGSAFSIDDGLAMSSRCEHKDAAWDFMRSQLMDNSYGWGFSVLQSQFDAYMEEAMTPDTWTDEEGNVTEYPKIEYTDSSGETVQIMAMSQKKYDQFLELLNNTTKMADYDESIMEIVMDEAQPFLAGKDSAEKVARMVQSRVRIYVNEQR